MMAIRVLQCAALMTLLFGAPRANAVTVYAAVEVGDEQNLFTFDSATPGTLDANVQITGTGTNRFSALDVRPATGELFGLALDGSITNAFLYVIDPLTAQATQRGAAIPLPQAAGVVSPGTRFGFDFNPVVDLIRVVSNSGDNFRLDPDTGAVVTADTMLSRQAIGSAAYNNNVAGAAQTTLFGIDGFNAVLVRIGGVNGMPSPNGGVVTTIGPLGAAHNSDAGFDIAPDGLALAEMNLGGVRGLYRINLATGQATFIGGIGMGEPNVLAMAIALESTAPRAPAPALSSVALTVALLVLAIIGFTRLRRWRAG